MGASDTRLIVYGTLAPGRENHHVVEPLGGTWREVAIEGVLGEWAGYPMFEWVDSGDRIPAWLLESDALPEHWARLDAFETDAYDRILIPCFPDDGVVIANCYVRATR